MTSSNTMTLEQIVYTFQAVTDYDTLHDSIVEDIEDTRLNKEYGDRACDMPGMGYHYVLDTKHYTLLELADLAAHYRQKLDALMAEDPEVSSGWRTWDILEYITGSDSLVAPPGVAVVTNDTIDSYAYPTISEYAQNNPVITIA